MLDVAYAHVCGQIGTLLIVETKAAVVLCLISAMKSSHVTVGEENRKCRLVEVELIGELGRDQSGTYSRLHRGVSVYPKLGDPVQPAGHDTLKWAYYFGDANAVEFGHIHQDQTIPAVVRLEHMLSKHFAILGSTGTGKSCTTALLLRQIIDKHPMAHILLLDPHSEYGGCFGDAVELIGLGNLNLPFWFLNFEETVEILIDDTSSSVDEIEILRDLIPAAKRQFASNNRSSKVNVRSTASTQSARYSVDIPVPYRISDLMTLIDEQMGKLEMKTELRAYRRLKSRIESVSRDPRYLFMFGRLNVEDNLATELRRIFRMPVEGKPITVMQLAGLPTQVVNVVVSVLARLAFDLAVWCEGKVPITIVCEEAHRYVPNNDAEGFEPARRAISRIAKEGRKYGVSLGVVSQRPGDVDPTILSQCSTLFAMRLTSARDQKIMHSALSDAAESLLNFLPTLGDGEAIVFGEGVNLPSRVVLSTLPSSAIPRGRSAGFGESWSAETSNETFVEQIVERWRESAHTGEDSIGVIVSSAAQASIDAEQPPSHPVADERPLPDVIDSAQEVQHTTPVGVSSIDALAARLKNMRS